jgi:hypothetical protein
MSSFTIIAGSLLTGFAAFYAIHKNNNIRNNKSNKSNKYEVFESDNYLIAGNTRIYKYTVKNPLAINSACKESLFGYPDKQKSIDVMLNEYTKTKTITNKRVIFDTKDWIGDIEIEEGNNEKTLVFKEIS